MIKVISFLENISILISRTIYFLMVEMRPSLGNECTIHGTLGSYSLKLLVIYI